MTDLLCKIFIKNREHTDNPIVRNNYGVLATIVGIIVNLLLFAGKLTVGLISNSSAITADAFNNLSDAGSSLISFISFKISKKPADRKHPYGHARMEYIASMIVSFLIFLIAFELFTDSIESIIASIKGEANLVFDLTTVIILAVAVLAKFWLFLFYNKISKKIDSTVLKATATDSLGDALSTSAVILAYVIVKLTGLTIFDGIAGILVACLIVKAGISVFIETLNSILGNPPSDDLIENIKNTAMSYPEVIGIHDLMVHDYGPGHIIVSFHAEVDGEKDVFDSHDAIDRLEKELNTKYHLQSTIHLDPIISDNEIISADREKVREIAKSFNENINIHDFRMVEGKTHTNFIFDLFLPFEEKRSDDEMVKLISNKVSDNFANTFCVISVDRG